MASSSSSPTLNAELVAALKRLKLGRIADTLPEPLVLADKQEMTFDDLVLLVLTDEITRRDNTAADTRAREARLDPQNRLEVWDNTSKVSFDKRPIGTSWCSGPPASARRSCRRPSVTSPAVTAITCASRGPTRCSVHYDRAASTTRATPR
jgi:hypothetical protein